MKEGRRRLLLLLLKQTIQPSKRKKKQDNNEISPKSTAAMTMDRGVVANTHQRKKT